MGKLSVAMFDCWRLYKIETRESKHRFLGKQPGIPPKWPFHHRKNEDRPLDFVFHFFYLNLQKTKNNISFPHVDLSETRMTANLMAYHHPIKLPLKWDMPQLLVCVLHIYL